MIARPGFAAGLALAALAAVAGAQEHEHAAPPLADERLGTVHFTTSCRPQTRQPFDRAVALLHSFEFGRAIEAFEATAKTDPACAMTHWGVALAAWGNPFAAGQKAAAQLQRGRDEVAAAAGCATATGRERSYIAAVAELYREVERRDQTTRLVSYRDSMRALAAAYPDDMEASIFYALALAQAAPPTDKTYADLLAAGQVLERLFATYPEHPGLAHYIIHSYDVPPLAARALPAARRYARIAPSAPHALHMPSHTFTRLGYWQESIDANIASAAAAQRDGATAAELHATDYQVYAYLQSGQDAAAKRLVDSLPAIAARFDEGAIGSAAPPVAGVFALAATPARWALERGDWAGAARLVPRAGRFPHTEAMTCFARALGAARSGDVAVARSAIGALQPLHERLVQAGESYWAVQVEIQSRAATAWLALAEGRRADALAAMRSAAELEDATEKNAITPGPLAPARELLGEMQLEIHEPVQALAEFEATLRREPGRFRALAGAARAAADAGDRATAAKYYRQLLDSCARGDSPGRPELEEARRVASAPSGSR
jgi:hypothetical protein